MVFLYFPFAADSNNTEFSFLFNSTLSFNGLLFATHPQESRPFKPLLGCLNKKYYLFFFVAITREEKDRNAETLGRQTGFQDLRACFIKQKLNDTKK